MFAGLPGTGIGGIFYLLLTLWMPVHELYLTARGRSSAERWRFIAYRWAVFASVIALLAVQATLLTAVLSGQRLSKAMTMDGITRTGSTFLENSGAVALTGLAMVVLTIYAVRALLLMNRWRRDRAA